MSKKTRPYDIVLIGATGFTGQLTADYLLKQKKPVKLALAGRNADKLAQVRDLLLADNPGAPSPDLLVADSHDMASLRRLCAQTRVVISTVGPYAQHGEDLVAACVAQKCDYVDLTGEPQFVTDMQRKYGADADANGVKIVHCCGFDSIPHDLGVYFVIQQLEKRLGAETMKQAEVSIEGFVRGHGDISGGTWNSAINAMPNWQDMIRERRKHYRQQVDGRDIRLVEKPRVRKLKDGWAAPLPTIDPVIIVQSARRYADYGKSFRYAHFGVVPQLHRLALTSAAVAGIFVVAQFGKGRDWLGKRRPSGVGPAPEDRARHWFKVELVADVKTAQGKAEKLRALVSGGDPGYDETAKMLAQSALCLVQDKDALPNNYGVVTPAEAMGALLVERLQAAGLLFEVTG